MTYSADVIDNLARRHDTGVPLNNIAALSKIILDNVPQGLEFQKSRTLDGLPTVQIRSPDGTAVHYLVVGKVITGPDPEAHDDGKSLLGATVVNIANFLSLEGLEYDPRLRLYRRV